MDSTVYTSRGVRALVLLHERHLREFLETWRAAKAANLSLPETKDPSYASLETLLRHVLRAARGYVVWTCENLGLADPAIRATPEPEAIEAEAETYLEHLLARWRVSLVELDDERLEHAEFRSPWGATYCIDGMLEHAVMHPIRHAFQLAELLAAR